MLKLGASAVAGSALMGCGSKAPMDTVSPDAGNTGPEPIDASSPPDAPTAVQCPSTDMGFAELFTGIDTVVVLCMENRSFDHYLGSLALSEGWSIDGLTGGESNLTSDGQLVPIYRLEDFQPDDPPHKWQECHAQFNGGKNDGFVREHAGSSAHQVMGYHERDQLATVYGLADHAAVCDRYFSSVMGPTWPNRYYINCGSSGGRKNNTPKFGLTSIWDQLDKKNISNRNFYHDIAWVTGGLQKTTGLGKIESYFENAAAGTLPAFSVIDPDFLGAGANDDHPNNDIRLGQALIGSVFAALAQSPQWSRSLFILTYDEHGGFYDHVPPPLTSDSREEFQQLGFRVPTIVAGPTVKRGCPVSQIYDHTSILTTTTNLFGLAPINKRVAAANDFRDCIHPDYIGNPQPAPTLPAVEISLRQVRALPEQPRHLELAAAAANLNLSNQLNRKAESLEIAERVLRYGERLGAVTLR